MINGKLKTFKNIDKIREYINYDEFAEEFVETNQLDKWQQSESSEHVKYLPSFLIDSILGVSSTEYHMNATLLQLAVLSKQHCMLVQKALTGNKNKTLAKQQNNAKILQLLGKNPATRAVQNSKGQSAGKKLKLII